MADSRGRTPLFQVAVLVVSLAAALRPAAAQLVSMSGDTLEVVPAGVCEPLSVEAEIFNAGAETVTIDRVEPSCGCTHADVEARELAPGASTWLRAELIPPNTDTTTLSESVALTTTGGDTLTLLISGTVERCARLETTQLDLGNVNLDGNEPRVERLTLVLHAPEAVEALDAVASLPQLTANFAPPGPEAHERLLEVALVAPITLGVQHEQIQVRLNGMKFEEIAVTWNGVSSRVKVDSVPVHFGQIASGQQAQKAIDLVLGQGWAIAQATVLPAALGEVLSVEASDNGARMQVALKPAERGLVRAELEIVLAGAEGARATYRLPLRAVAR